MALLLGLGAAGVVGGGALTHSVGHVAPQVQGSMLPAPRIVVPTPNAGGQR